MAIMIAISQLCHFYRQESNEFIWEIAVSVMLHIGVLHQKSALQNVVTQMETFVSVADPESVIQVYIRPWAHSTGYYSLLTHSASVCATLAKHSSSLLIAKCRVMATSRSPV